MMKFLCILSLARFIGRNLELCSWSDLDDGFGMWQNENVNCYARRVWDLCVCVCVHLNKIIPLKLQLILLFCWTAFFSRRAPQNSCTKYKIYFWPFNVKITHLLPMALQHSAWGEDGTKIRCHSIDKPAHVEGAPNHWDQNPFTTSGKRHAI